MDPTTLDALRRTLDESGPDAALQRLGEELKRNRDYNALFYARLLGGRHRLGVVPVPTFPTSDVPPERLDEFEKVIRDACQEVGSLFLAEGNIPQAWVYFRMLGDPMPVVKALAECQPAEDEDIEGLIQVALHEGVLPRKGFDWVLERYGLCAAITTLGQHQHALAPEVRNYCVGRLVRALYQELRERLTADITARTGSTPAIASAPPDTLGVVRELIRGRDELFTDDCYHIDFSHLSSVVQMSIHLEPGDDLERARELCEYGDKLSPNFKHPGEPPFEDTYRDLGVYLSILAGHEVEKGLAHFQAILEANPPEEAGTGPAQTLVQLLQRLGRPEQALGVARKYLAGPEPQRLAYLAELCRAAGDYSALADAAREHNDAVHYLAGLLATRQG